MLRRAGNELRTAGNPLPIEPVRSSLGHARLFFIVQALAPSTGDFPTTPEVFIDEFDGAEGIAFNGEGRLFLGADGAVWIAQPDGKVRRIADVDAPLGLAGVGPRDILAADFGPANVFQHGPNDDGIVWRITPEGGKRSPLRESPTRTSSWCSPTERSSSPTTELTRSTGFGARKSRSGRRRCPIRTEWRCRWTTESSMSPRSSRASIPWWATIVSGPSTLFRASPRDRPPSRRGPARGESTAWSPTSSGASTSPTTERGRSSASTRGPAR